MLELVVTLAPVSLLDSLSLLPFAVVVLAALLAGPRPYAASVAFLIGIFASYLAAGVLIAVGLGQVIQRVSKLLVHWFNNPVTLDYVLGMVVGVALIALGYRWANARRGRASRRQPALGMTPVQALGLGAGATLAGLWGALPYFAAIDQLLKAELSLGESLVALAFYNVVFISVPTALVGLKAWLGARADVVFERVNRLIAVWGRRLLIAGMIALGTVMLADGIGWLVGRPLLPTG